MPEGGAGELRLARRRVEAMRAALEAALPEEGCGLLFGRGPCVERVVPIPNALHSTVRFRLEPRAQLAAMQEADEQGLELLAIYHSHPCGPDHPSATDIEEAAYPQAAYLIWWQDVAGRWQYGLFWLEGLEDSGAPRGYRLGRLMVEAEGEARPA
jgi:proteasome lid subunit RPN8/RPN11